MIRFEKSHELGGFTIKLMGDALTNLTMEQIAGAYQKAGADQGVWTEEAVESVRQVGVNIFIDCEVGEDHALRMLNILYPNVDANIYIPEDCYEGGWLTYNGTAFIIG